MAGLIKELKNNIMKKLMTILMLLLVTLMNGQKTEFTFTKEGFTDFVIAQCEGKTQSELYKKTLDWISVTYNNPKEVIKAQIENDYIRIEGISKSLLCTKSLIGPMCDDLKYQIEISFKDGKYKFDIINSQQYIEPSQYSSISGWIDCGFIKTTQGYYKANGDLKNPFKEFPTAITNYFNTLNKSLHDFVMSETIPSKKSDW